MKVILSTLNAKFIHTSLAIRLLKAYSEHAFDIELAEYTIKDPVMNIVSDLFQRRPDVIGFSCYIWNIEETLRVIDIVKKVMPEVKIVLGGPEVSYDTGFWMERAKGVDFIVMGEGEETFHHLLQVIEGDRKYHFVYGIAYRKGEEVIINPPRPKSDLNSLPSPHRFQEDIPNLGKRIVYFETSRGCPFQCQFCLSSIENGVRYYDIERVKADITYLIDKGAKVIKFLDRTFNINHSYAMEMFKFLIENNRGCIFQFEITADIMRPEVLQFLADNAPPGIFRFEIGVQSTNDPTNVLVKRQAKLREAVPDRQYHQKQRPDRAASRFDRRPAGGRLRHVPKNVQRRVCAQAGRAAARLPENAARDRPPARRRKIRIYLHGSGALRNSRQP